MTDDVDASSPWPRLAAALTLLATAWLGSGNAEASSQTADTLLAALGTTSDENARVEILYSLGEYHSDAVRLALEGIAGDGAEPGAVRMQAICSLAGSATAESVPLLMQITETDLRERHGYWACAIPLLGQIKDRRALPLLLRVALLNEEDLAGMDHMAISAIASMADQRDVPFLVSVAYVVPVRPTVMQALGRIASPASCEVLVGGLQDGEEQETVEAAQRGLKKIGRPALPFLNAALKHLVDPVFAGRVRALLAEIR